MPHIEVMEKVSSTGHQKPKAIAMPKRKDVKKILIIGSGPIVIGKGCEFDYSGARACIRNANIDDDPKRDRRE
jgi:hypothetical protein